MTQNVLYHFVKQLNSEFIGPILVFVLLGAGVFGSVEKYWGVFLVS